MAWLLSTSRFLFSESDLPSLKANLARQNIVGYSSNNRECSSRATTFRNESSGLPGEVSRVRQVKTVRDSRKRAIVSCVFSPPRKWLSQEYETGNVAGGVEGKTGLDLKDLFVVKRETKDEAESKTGFDLQDLFVAEQETKGAAKGEAEGKTGFDLRDLFIMKNKIPKADQTFHGQTIESISEKYLNVQEKHIDIPIVDNEAFRKNLMTRIEAVTSKIIEQIANGQLPCISYVGGQNTIVEFDSQKEIIYPERLIDSQEGMEFSSETPIDFTEQQDMRINANKNKSGRTIVDFAAKRSRKKFILMTMIMAETYHLLLTNTTKTKRSFYYSLKELKTESLAPNQQYVDRALNNVANLLECTPWDLRLMATAKGLMAGNMSITLVDNQVIDCAIPGGVLIPHIVSNVTSIRAKAMFVLVVEKEAVFQKLLEENCPRILNCILVTGKGYPDVATRMLVKLLSEKMDLPVYIIVDADPSGVDIMLIYRFGSTALRKENKYLACPNARWLGIFPTELLVLGAKTIPLTEADFAKLRSIEARAYVNEAVSKELSVLRQGKAEIETVSSLSKNFLTAMYVPYKIDGRNYI